MHAHFAACAAIFVMEVLACGRRLVGVIFVGCSHLSGVINPSILLMNRLKIILIIVWVIIVYPFRLSYNNSTIVLSTYSSSVLRILCRTNLILLRIFYSCVFKIRHLNWLSAVLVKSLVACDFWILGRCTTHSVALFQGLLLLVTVMHSVRSSIVAHDTRFFTCIAETYNLSCSLVNNRFFLFLLFCVIFVIQLSILVQHFLGNHTVMLRLHLLNYMVRRPLICNWFAPFMHQSGDIVRQKLSVLTLFKLLLLHKYIVVKLGSAHVFGLVR